MATAATSEQRAQAHIAAQTQLQLLVTAGVAAAWDRLPNYDEVSVAPFLATVVPIVLAAQARAAALTNIFLAREVGRPPIGVDLAQVTGAAIRTATAPVIEASQHAASGLTLPDDATGVPPEIVYRRPFVEVWGALSDHTPWADAVAMGRDRATGTAAMDVQNTMRHTLRLVGEHDNLILGYRRLPDPNACPFCKIVAGRRYHTWQLMEVHLRCRCGVEVITDANRDQFFGARANDVPMKVTRDGLTAAVVDHGELGPLLVNGDQSFTSLADVAALAA